MDNGVNLIAPIHRPTGIATVAERYRMGFEAAGLAVNQIDVEAAPDKHRSTPFDINVVCLDIATEFALRLRFEPEFFQNRINIGIWSWELPTFPRRWFDRFLWYDEIWVPSEFLASVLAPISPVPVLRMPPVLEPSAMGSRQRGRTSLSLSDDEFVFAFLFNFYSRHQRKNPLALIDAFKAAFPQKTRARLIIKCLNSEFDRACYDEMQCRSASYPVRIYDGEWSSQQVLDFTAACDCYVSLHRSEGLGLSVSDAMAIAKPVVATGWSGNMDYMNVSNSFPVRYEMTKLRSAVGPFDAGSEWAEPSTEHAAELMRFVFEHREQAEQRGGAAQAEIGRRYSAQTVGAMVAERVALLRKRDRFREVKRLTGDNAALAEEFRDLGPYVSDAYREYEEVKSRLQAIVAQHLPQKARLLVVTKGDENLLDFASVQAAHFPQTASGEYAGHHPANGREAIRHLEALRVQGAEYLVLPRPYFWWLESYPEFGEFVRKDCRAIHTDAVCMIFDLGAGNRREIEVAHA